MKLTATTVLILAVLLTASLALADSPLNGQYLSTDLGGPVNTGRYTEGFPVPNGALEIGTTLNAASWDGATLAGQWRYWCAVEQVPAVLISNTVVNGNGSKTWLKVYTGGYLWLSGSGPWANGDADYPGVIDTYQEIETHQFLNNVRIHAVTNITAIGHFDNYPSECMTFTVGNGVEIGSTDFGQTKPATYPDLLEPDCNATAIYGAWWDFIDMSLVISDCSTVPTEETTWGAVKARYAE